MKLFLNKFSEESFKKKYFAHLNEKNYKNNNYTKQFYYEFGISWKIIMISTYFVLSAFIF